MTIRNWTAAAIAAALITTFGMASDAGAAAPTKAAPAPAAKPAAGCLLKSGTRSPDGTVIGTWKCEGTAWAKITRPTYLFFMTDATTTTAAATPSK